MARCFPDYFSFRRLMGVAVTLCAAGLIISGTPAKAQSQAQWDSLYEKIIRLEANVRDIQARGVSSGGAAGGSSGHLQMRVDNLEDQLRQLMGQMQEMNSRLRQMQNNRSGSAQPAPGNNSVAELPAATQNGWPTYSENLNSYAEPDISIETGPDVTETYTGSFQQGSPPTNLGTLTVPGNPEAAQLEPGQPRYNESVEVTTLDGQQVAALSSASGPDQLYQMSYDSLRGKRYGDAEIGFRDFVSKYDQHPLAGNAQYWLGQTFYARGEYPTAAREFLTGYKKYKQSKKAPASLLKLGMSLKKMGQKKQACASFAQIRKEFPKAAKEKKLASKEASRAGC